MATMLKIQNISKPKVIETITEEEWKTTFKGSRKFFRVLERFPAPKEATQKAPAAAESPEKIETPKEAKVAAEAKAAEADKK